MPISNLGANAPVAALSQPIEGSAVASDLSRVEYDSKEASDDSRHRVLWSRVMDEGNYATPINEYKKVEVLMLRWAEEHDDLKVSGEIERLRAVFKNRFGYSVKVHCLSDSPRVNLEMSRMLSGWLLPHCEAENTLLIIYYAGHGTPGKRPGEMLLHG